ncbi:hypothetical protein LUZ60_000018 [Juncus effusus]|nr:hypothetical protein LUZ60_000018 [Juncus effusus]
MTVTGTSDLTCGSLLQQLQRVWDEVGESDEDRDKILLQLDQECLDVYKRKVDQATHSRDSLIQSLDDSKIELARLLSALGEKTIVRTPEKSSGTIKEQLAAIAPTLDQLNKQKAERIDEFIDVQSQIEKICGEIAGTLEVGDQVGPPEVDEEDLSLEKLEDFRSQLQELQKEKSNRQQKVLDYVSTVHELCTVLGLDFFGTVTEVHPSLDDSIDVHAKSISDETLSKLDQTVEALNQDKKTRLHKLQELAMQLSDLWNLMETPKEERSFFDHVTCNINSTVDEVTSDGALALDLIEQAEVEVERLDQLKSSKMKEIALKKQSELEDIYTNAHVIIDSKSAREKLMIIIDGGNVEPSELIADMDDQIVRAKEEALSRKDILDKVERWMSACDEESWLEDYNQDHNRYSSSRGAHLNLKRAEKARILCNKIPALVDTLVAKTRAWEEERDTSFMYDGVPLLAMLDEYLMLRQEREEEKRRLRDQKKYSAVEPVITDHSPNKTLSTKKVVGIKSNGTPNGPTNRRLSVNGGTNGTRSGSGTKERRESTKSSSASNSVALADAASCVSGTDPVPNSP